MSIHEKCLETTRTEIRNLNLAGINSSSVHVLSVSTDRAADIGGSDRSVTYPYVLISPYGQETIGGPENQADDITYPVLVCLVDNVNQNQSTNLKRNLGWREKLIDHFHYNRFAAVNGNNETTVQPLTIVDPNLFVKGNRWVSGLLINFTCTRARRVSP